MELNDRSRVLHVLNRAFAGDVVNRREASAAIREFEGLVEELYDKPSKWDYITLPKTEVQNMRDAIEYQAKKISDLNARVNDAKNSHRMRDPLPVERDKSDFMKRMALVQTFEDIYSKEWRAAYKELFERTRWPDEEIIYTLLRVIRTACDLTYDLSCDQIDRLVVDMENVMINPVNGNQSRFKKMFSGPDVKYTPGMVEAEKFAADYREKRAAASGPAIVELYMESKLRNIINPDLVKPDLRTYIEKCVETIWLMTAMNPHMRLYWQQQSERLLPDMFTVYHRRGDYVNQTVWPAVFEHGTGRLLSKGVVLTM